MLVPDTLYIKGSAVMVLKLEDVLILLLFACEYFLSFHKCKHVLCPCINNELLFQIWQAMVIPRHTLNRWGHASI